MTDPADLMRPAAAVDHDPASVLDYPRDRPAPPDRPPVPIPGGGPAGGSRDGAVGGGRPHEQGGLRVQLAQARPGLVVVDVAGEIDLATRAEFDRVLTQAVTAAPGHRVVVDLSRVSFLAACAVSTLFAAHAQACRCGAALWLVAAPGARAAAARHAARAETCLRIVSTRTTACAIASPAPV